MFVEFHTNLDKFKKMNGDKVYLQFRPMVGDIITLGDYELEVCAIRYKYGADPVLKVELWIPKSKIQYLETDKKIFNDYYK